MADEATETEAVAVPAKAKGVGARAPLPAMPAPKRPIQRRIPVRIRAPFLPVHHGHTRHGLKPHKD